MDDQQPTFKVVDRRPFNPDGTPRDVPPDERKAEHVEEPVTSTAPESAPPQAATQTATPPPAPSSRPEPESRLSSSAPRREPESVPTGRDPLDDPASFLSLIMSLASNAAASMGMMPHPVTGETGVDLTTAKHWIDVLGMLEQKTQGNLNPQEAQVLEGLLADLRMQYVSLTGTPTPAAAKFNAGDITGGK